MSTRSLKASLVLDLLGNFPRQARRFGQSFRQMGQRGERELGRIGRAAAAMDRRLNRALVRGGALAGAAAAAGGAFAVRRIGTLEQRLERLGIAAERTSAQMEEVRNQVNDVASAADIKIDPGEILGALEAFTEATGDFDFANQIKREMALAIQATGSGGAEIGRLMAVIQQKFGIRTPAGMLAAVDTLAQQGKAGAVELGNLATLGPKIFSAFARFGGGGVGGLAEAGALAQMFKEGVGSPEEAATVFENVINNLYNPAKMKKLRKAGVQMHGADGHLLGPMEMIEAVIRSAGGKDLNLAKVFDAEAMRGFGVLSKIYRETGGFAPLRDLAGIRGDGSVVKTDSARMAGTMNAVGRNVLTNINDAIEDNAMEPIRELTKSLDALLDSGIALTADDALNLALAGVGTIAAAKGGLWALRGGDRGRGAGGKGSTLPGGALDAVPVIVTNWPGSMRNRGGATRRGIGAGTAGAAGAGAGAAARRGIFGRAVSLGGRVASRAFPLIGSGLIAADIASLSHDGPRHTGDQGAVDRALSGTRRPHTHALPPGVVTPGRAEIGGVRQFHGEGPTAADIQAFIDTQRDGVDETAASGSKVVAAIDRMRRDLVAAQRSAAVGAGPSTGRVMVGPQ